MPSTTDPDTGRSDHRARSRRAAGRGRASSRLAWVLAIVASLTTAGRSVAGEDLADVLRAARPQLAASPFGRPILLTSSDRDGVVRGTVLALVDHPIDEVRARLDTPAEWCEVLILHLNVKGCDAGRAGNGRSLTLLVGRKGSEEGDGNHAIELRFGVTHSTSQRVEMVMTAEAGPVGTRDYRLLLEAMPVGPKSSFLRFDYTYAYGPAARMATSTYLRTLGRDKVGFSVTGRTPDGSPAYVGGLRGVLERNIMRYYLAIETCLASAAQPVASRVGWRYRAWYDATERYSRQLHELSKADYLAGKQGGLGDRVAEPRFVVSGAFPG